MRAFKRLVSSCAMSAIAVAMIAPVAVVAQETTADIRGRISGSGQALSGANVQVTHIASGTRASARTGGNGEFVISGLRAGGPYSIEVSALNFQSSWVSDVFLSVSEPFEMALNLESASQKAETVVVTGERIGRVVGDGSATTLRREAIEARVIINQDLRELARSSPLVSQTNVGLNGAGDGGISIAGSNPRTNRITIDGVQAQDDFGLNTGGFPTRRGPIAIDAISQFNVSATPFDVKNGGFLGGAIDIVLRSGENKFGGSIFGKFQDDSLTGAWIDRKRLDGTVVEPRRVQPIIDQKNFGATFRGPILKDRVFFALAYESFESSDTTPRGPAGLGFSSGFIDPVTGAADSMTQAQIDAVTNVYKNVYGGTRNLGGFPLTKPVTDEKYSVRLDWNINDQHRANFTYRKATSELSNFTNLFNNSAALDSQWYLTGEDDETYSVQLNSKWTDNLTTEARLSLRDYTRLQEPPGGQDFSDVRVCATPTGENTSISSCQNSAGTNRTIVRFGPDQFRHANYLTNKNVRAFFEARYRVANHDMKAGIEHSDRKVYNLFVANSDGQYYFDSIAAFTAGTANELIYQNAPSGKADDAAADFGYAITSLYAQDAWRLSEKLRLNLGVRYEQYSMDDKPVANANFLARNGFSNTNTYDGLDIWMPRSSFQWDPMSGLKISGGVGLFSGGLPDVFLSNSFSNTGIATVGVTIQRAGSGNCVGTVTIVGGFCETSNAPGFTAAIGSAALDGLVGPNFGKQIPASILALLGGVTPNPLTEVNAIAPNFEVPSEWKANLAISKTLPWGLRAGFDGVMTKVKTGYAFRDARAVPLIVNGAQALTPDGRKRYDNLSAAQRTAVVGTTVNSSAAVGGTSRDIILYNTTGDLGEGYVAALSLAKTWSWGLRTSVSYTYQNLEEASNTGRFSSTASSLYGGQYSSVDPNAPVYGRAQEEIRNTIKYSADWKGTPIGDLETRISLFGDKRSGRPFTFTMSPVGGGRSTVFGVNKTGMLAYIPNFSGITDAVVTATSAGVTQLNPTTFAINGDSKVAFDNLTTLNNVRNLVNSFGLPQGQITSRSLNRNDDVHLVDLKINQQIPAPFQGHKALISFEIGNVLNLINDEWGIVDQYSEDQQLFQVLCAGANGLADNAGAVTCNRYRISNASTILTNTPALNLERSRWQITIGLRYEF